MHDLNIIQVLTHSARLSLLHLEFGRGEDLIRPSPVPLQLPHRAERPLAQLSERLQSWRPGSDLRFRKLAAIDNRAEAIARTTTPLVASSETLGYTSRLMILIL
jgi:hypothetical protein